MKPKVKVNVDSLIEQIIFKKNEVIQQHKEQLLKYKKELFPIARKKTD
jgi:hypothetical protein